MNTSNITTRHVILRYGPLNKNINPNGPFRCSGMVQCPECMLLYIEHPMDYWDLSYCGEPFLHVLCSGERVKL